MQILIINRCGSTNPARRIIHNNSVKEEFVYFPEEYKYSSGVNYAEGKVILDDEIICMNKSRIENPNNKEVREYKSRTTNILNTQPKQDIE